MSAIKNLVNEIVDYAGLFPPAKLPLDEVAINFEAYLNSKHSWMLARLIVPAGRLIELEQQAAFSASDHHWRISSIVPFVDAAENGFETAMRTIDDFNSLHEDSGRAIVDTIEIKANTIALIKKTATRIPESIKAFIEVPHQDDPNELIEAIGNSGDNIFGKIRTGGVTKELIPPAEQVARFIARCAQHDVGFKATAGLHHPICGSYRLTYDPDPSFGNMFGYLNVFLATAFAFGGLNENNLVEILKETTLSNFEFTDDQINWKEHAVTSEQLINLRKNHAISFGSCSFTEPTDELLQFGLVNAEVA